MTAPGFSRAFGSRQARSLDMGRHISRTANENAGRPSLLQRQAFVALFSASKGAIVVNAPEIKFLSGVNTQQAVKIRPASFTSFINLGMPANRVDRFKSALPYPRMIPAGD